MDVVLKKALQIQLSDTDDVCDSITSQSGRDMVRTHHNGLRMGNSAFSLFAVNQTHAQHQGEPSWQSKRVLDTVQGWRQ